MDANGCEKLTTDNGARTNDRSAIVPLYSYQKKFIESDARFRLLNWSRQTGKSFSEALDAVLKSLETQSNSYIMSGSQDQSDDLMDKVKMHCQALNVVVEEVEPAVVEYDDMKLIRRMAKLPGGRRILTVPANPLTARGKTGNIYLDEFAMHRRDREIWKAIAPSVTRGKLRLTVASTHNGKKTEFYRLLSNPIFEQYKVTIYDAVKQGYPADPEELRALLDDEEAWMEEYLCEPQDEATAYLTYEMIQACERADLSKDLAVGFKAEGNLYAGMDVGRRKDLTVIWLWEELGDVLWTRAVIELLRMPFAAQEEMAGEIITMDKFHRMAVDETGLGMQLTENLQKKHGKYKVEGVTFNNAVKQELAGGLRIKMEDQLARIPADQKIRNDLHSVKKTVTAAGNIRFDADSTKDGHADRFWAAGLGVHATDKSKNRPRMIVAGKN